MCEVHAEYVFDTCVCERHGEVASAACDIEYDVVRFDIASFDGGSAPGLVLPHGVKSVVEVVGFGDGSEHVLYASGLVWNDVWIDEVVGSPFGFVIGGRLRCVLLGVHGVMIARWMGFSKGLEVVSW